MNGPGQSDRAIAVIGATSFFGARLIPRLLVCPEVTSVVGIDVHPPQKAQLPPAARYERIDLTEQAADSMLRDIFERERVDTVVHLAYLARPVHQQAWAHELETIGTMQILNACAEVGVRHIVAISTTMCYGAYPDNPCLLTEAHALRGAAGSRWVNDKVDAEQQLERYRSAHQDSTVTVLRMAPVIGPDIGSYWSNVLSRPVVLSLLGYDPVLQLLHEDDAVTGLLSAVLRVPNVPLNIVPHGVLPLSRVLGEVGAVALPLPAGLSRSLFETLWGAQVVRTPPSFLCYLRYPWNADGSRARRALDFSPNHSTLQAVRAFARSRRRFSGVVPTAPAEVS